MTDTTMTDVDTPKNCPWCGSSARVYQPIEGYDYWVVECTGDVDEVSGCFAEAPYIAGYDTKEKALAAWDTRPAEDALASRCDELERLAVGMQEAIQRGKETGVFMHAVSAAEVFTAYQRKGE